MNVFPLRAAQTVERTDQGRLRLSVLAADRSQPIDNASVTISYSGDPDSIIEEANTDSSGQIPELTLPAPPLEYSMAPSEYQPYAEYTFRISKEGYEDLEISGAEILPDVTATQQAFLRPAAPGPCRLQQRQCRDLHHIHRLQLRRWNHHLQPRTG